MNECLDTILSLRSYKINITVDKNHLQRLMSRLIRAVIYKQLRTASDNFILYYITAVILFSSQSVHAII